MLAVAVFELPPEGGGEDELPVQEELDWLPAELVLPLGHAEHRQFDR